MEKPNNQSLEDKKTIDKVLDTYEQSIGLPQFPENYENDDVKQYLSMTHSQMSKMMPEDVAQASVILGCFAYHLQRCHNREMATVGWASSKLKKMISGREGQYKGSWDSQFQQAINNDTYASKLNDIKNYAQQRADRITFLANSVRNICNDLKGLQRAKEMK